MNHSWTVANIALRGCALTALLSGTVVSARQVTVDLDARVHGAGSALAVPLGAGCWKITPVAGTYTAWHAWGGTNTGCDSQGLGCSQGRATLFFYSSTAGTAYGSTGFYADQTIALANAREAYVNLPQATTVFFGVADQSLGDNLGGVSLLIELDNPGVAADGSPRHAAQSREPPTGRDAGPDRRRGLGSGD